MKFKKCKLETIACGLIEMYDPQMKSNFASRIHCSRIGMGFQQENGI